MTHLELDERVRELSRLILATGADSWPVEEHVHQHAHSAEYMRQAQMLRSIERRLARPRRGEGDVRRSNAV